MSLGVVQSSGRRFLADLSRRDGSKKDTLLNIEASGEFVINSAVESVAEAVNLTLSIELP